MLTLGWKLFVRNLFFGLILALQLMIALFFCNVAIGYQNGVSAVNRPLAAFSEGAFFYQSMFRDERALAVEKKLAAAWRMEFLFPAWHTAEDDAVFYLGENTAARFRGQLNEGVWCTDATPRNGAIPCVTAGKKYDLGDTIALSTPQGERLSL